MTCTRSRRTRSADGISLLEVLLALAILAGAAAGMLAIRANALRNSVCARNERVAAMAASSLLAEATLGRPAPGSTRHDLAGHPGFTCRTTLDAVSVGQFQGVQRYRVEVSYPVSSHDGDTRELLVMETFLDRPEKARATTP